MPIKRFKTSTMKNFMKNRNMSRTKKNKYSSKLENIQKEQHNSKQQNLLNLISMISQARKNRSKSQTNLPARLMKMSNMQKSKSFAKTVSSTYSSIFKNGQKYKKIEYKSDSKDQKYEKRYRNMNTTKINLE